MMRRLLAAIECARRGHDWFPHPSRAIICWRCTTTYGRRRTRRDTPNHTPTDALDARGV